MKEYFLATTDRENRLKAVVPGKMSLFMRDSVDGLYIEHDR